MSVRRDLRTFVSICSSWTGDYSYELAARECVDDSWTPLQLLQMWNGWNQSQVVVVVKEAVRGTHNLSVNA